MLIIFEFHSASSKRDIYAITNQVLNTFIHNEQKSVIAI